MSPKKPEKPDAHDCNTDVVIWIRSRPEALDTWWGYMDITLTISFNEYEYGATSVAHIADTPLCIRDLCRIWDMDTLQKVWLQRGVVTATYHYMISRIILSKDDYSIDVEWVD